MKINENHPSFIYIRTTSEKIPVTQEVCDVYYGEAAQIRTEAQAHGRCICPQHKVWTCDSDCLICEYRRSGDLASLDDPIDEDEEDILLNVIPSEVPSIESIIEDRELLDHLFTRLRELDPEADIIIAMWLDDYNVSDRAIAEALGRPQHTFADQMKKYRAEFKRIRGF